MAKTYQIHPAIGIARLGNATVDIADDGTYYLSPEVPHQVPNEGKSYKVGGKIKKQGQRFRIFEYENGVPTREITLSASDVEYISWDVQLVNGKAALNSRLPPAQQRNQQAAYTGNRKYLRIDSKRPDKNNPDATFTNVVGQKSSGSSSKKSFDTSKKLQGFVRFAKYSGGQISDELDLPGTTVPLGEMYSETGSGRLIVFGGNGKSNNPTGIPLGHAVSHAFANNDGWYDDTSDGIITAEIGFKGSTVPVSQDSGEARIICSVPRYAPAIESFVTLYDVAKEVYYDPAASLPTPSFWRDIYPILLRTSRHQWVSAPADAGHGTGKGGDFASPGQLKLLMDKSSPTATARRKMIVSRLRNPNDLNDGDMAILNGVASLDGKPVVPRSSDAQVTFNTESFTLTKLQYAQMEKWAEGDFTVDDADKYPSSLDDLDIKQQPAAVDRAAMDSCLARAFYPGIECCYTVELLESYNSVFRIKESKLAGYLSQGNSLPWQTDYLACSREWWPSQRPNRVYREIDGNYVPGQAWTEGVSNAPDMLDKWSHLGFIVQEGMQFVETERDPQLAS